MTDVAATPPRPETENGITVLVVDDERSNVESLEKIFSRDGMRVLVAYDAKRALEQLRSHKVDVVLTDLMMPGTTGLELLPAVKQVAPDVEVVLMTAFGSVEAAVTAMREGAYDFVEKPLKRLSIVKSVRQAAERQKLVAENRFLKDEIKLLTKREIVGSAPAWRRVVDVASQAAPSMATVLVLGESGTSSRASCSVTSAAPSPGRTSSAKGALPRHRAGRSSLTRLASSRPLSR
jgi:two-component system response regulator HydG